MSREPRRDSRAEVGRHEGRAAREAFGDQMSLLRLLLRVIFLPFWFPFYLRGVVRRQRERKEFVLERARNRLVSDLLVNEIAVAWAEAHPDEYPLAEYDPGLKKLRSRFRRITEGERR